MPGLEETLAELSRINRSGAAFLLAYGATWLICAVLWRTVSPKHATWATLFQGMVALPVALGVSAWLGMLDARPGGEALAQLGVVLSVSQLVVLPLLIVLTAKGRYSAVPLVFSIAGAVHFVPFAWLYQSWLYLAMPVVLAIGLAVVYGTDRAVDTPALMSDTAAGKVCALTGGALLLTGVLALLLS